MSLELVTGKRGEAHVKSEDIGAFNAGIVSAGQYVLSTGSKFNYEIVTNNFIWIYDGEAINQGRHMRIKPNDYEIVTIENGTQSQKRNDLIVLRYSKDTETGIESAEIKVIKGTSGSVPTDPPYMTGNILTGDTTDDFPLYRVYLDGLNIESVEPLFHVLCSMEELKNNVSELNSDLDNIATEVKTVNNTFGYGTFSNGYVSIGKTVCVSFQVLLATNIAAGKNLCSGLPQPLSDIAILNVYNGAMSSYSRAKITSDGVVYVESGHNSGASLLVNGSYIAK